MIETDLLNDIETLNASAGTNEQTLLASSIESKEELDGNIYEESSLESSINLDGIIHGDIDTSPNDYIPLKNKPKINNIELNGNLTLDDLGIQAKGNYIEYDELQRITNIEIDNLF